MNEVNLEFERLVFSLFLAGCAVNIHIDCKNFLAEFTVKIWKADMKLSFNPDTLIFADDNQTSLTPDCQESVKRTLVEEAFKMTYEEEKTRNVRQRTCNHYYHELACFMMQYPNVLIEPILLKPDLSEAKRWLSFCSLQHITSFICFLYIYSGMFFIRSCVDHCHHFLFVLLLAFSCTR